VRASDSSDPAWSPDGARIVFHDSHLGTWGGLATMDAAGNNLTTCPCNVTAFNYLDFFYNPSWSPDGIWLVADNEYYDSGDGDFDATTVFHPGGGGGRQAVGFSKLKGAAWSPDGTRIYAAYDNTIEIQPADGSWPEPPEILFTGPADWVVHQPNVSPDGSRIAFWRTIAGSSDSAIYSVRSDGTDLVRLSGPAPASDSAPAWSPDGTKIVFARIADGYDLWVMNPDGSNPVNITNTPTMGELDPDWQPIPVNGYPRPKAATPLYVPLVPAFQPCASPNRVHAPPLNYGSCKPPAQASSTLTIGTFDSNGAAINSTGFVKLRVVPGGDVALSASITDVRCRLPFIATCHDTNAVQLPDYTGELRLSAIVRATDKLNSPAPTPSGQGAGTVQDTGFGPSIPCTETIQQTGIGSSCSLSTTVNALIPGLVVDGARSNWQFDQVRLYDGGTDGDGDTQGDNTLFAVQGVFVP
jgi:hypothetical protein